MTPRTANIPIIWIVCARGSASVPGGVPPMASNSNILIGVRLLLVMRDKLAPKFLKHSRDNRLPRPPQQAQEKVQVVPRDQPQPQNLIRPEQMPEVRPREIPARVTFASLFQWSEVFPVCGVLDRITAGMR